MIVVHKHIALGTPERLRWSFEARMLAVMVFTNNCYTVFHPRDTDNLPAETNNYYATSLSQGN
jgi:hypothetical protein